LDRHTNCRNAPSASSRQPAESSVQERSPHRVATWRLGTPSRRTAAPGHLVAVPPWDGGLGQPALL